MTADRITTRTVGMVSTEILEDAWDGKVYWLKAKITVNPQSLTNSDDQLQSNACANELDELRKKSNALLRENERLANELRETKAAAKQETVRTAGQNTGRLSASDWLARGYEAGKSGNNTDALDRKSVV